MSIFSTYPDDPTPQNVEAWFDQQTEPVPCEDCGYKRDDVEFCICPIGLELMAQRIPAILCTGCYADRFDQT